MDYSEHSDSASTQTGNRENAHGTSSIWIAPPADIWSGPIAHSVKASGLFLRTLSVLAGLALGLLAIKFGQLDQGYRVLQRYPPDFTTIGWLKLLATLVASACLFFGLVPRAASRGFFDDSPNPTLVLSLSLVVAALVVWLICAVAWTPLVLSPMTAEGAVVEVLSEIFLAGTVVTALSLLRKVGQVPHARIGAIPAALPVLAMGAVAFLILMEELSWGQHKFGFGTPELFSDNVQNETNLHNFYTYRVDLAFYSTAFVVFMLLPWLWPKHPGRYLKLITFYIPPVGLILISAPLCGLFYESWNTVPFQIVLFLGVFVMVHSSLDVSRGTKVQRLWCGTMALLMVAAQVVFLMFGHNMSEGHELSEFRELLISAMMFLYAAWLAWKIRQPGAAASGP